MLEEGYSNKIYLRKKTTQNMQKAKKDTLNSHYLAFSFSETEYQNMVQRIKMLRLTFKFTAKLTFKIRKRTFSDQKNFLKRNN